MNSSTKLKGILARFKNPGSLLHAAEKVRDEGYKRFDSHSPFPIHGMDAAMGLKRSPLGWIVGLAATIGAGGGLLLQWWTLAVDYPLIISGKPYFAFQAYVPVTFGLGVLLSAITALVAMLVLNGLPRPHHWLFYSEKFAVVTDDGFFISIESSDPKFDTSQTMNFLKSIGAEELELVEESK